jgi:hypothetical protein
MGTLLNTEANEITPYIRVNLEIACGTLKCMLSYSIDRAGLVQVVHRKSLEDRTYGLLSTRLHVPHWDKEDATSG